MNMLKISKAIFRSLLSSRSLCVVVVALMVLCALPVFRSAAGIDGRVEYLESGITRVEQELSASYADALVNAGRTVSIPLHQACPRFCTLLPRGVLSWHRSLLDFRFCRYWMESTRFMTDRGRTAMGCTCRCRLVPCRAS